MAARSLASRIFAVVDPGGRLGDTATALDKAVPILFLSAFFLGILSSCAGMIVMGVLLSHGPGAFRFGPELLPAMTETLRQNAGNPTVSLDDLGMVAPLIMVSEDSIFAAEGTGCVWRPKEKGVLWVVTNRHVLGLEDSRPRGSLPSVRVEFPTGARASPKRVGLIDGVDLAVLEISEDGLEEGRDFLPLMPATDADWEALKPSKEIAMVGSMLGLQQSRSFGRIGALRDYKLDFRTPAARWIQIDGTILPGNSGGPLLVKHDELWQWIGVNTLGYEGQVGFAIHTSELFRHPIDWFNATPSVPRSR